MKPGIVISIAFIALIVLVIIQFYLISEVYDLKKKEFDFKYVNLIKEAVDDLDEFYNSTGLDTVFLLLDVIAYELLDTIDNIEFQEDRPEFNNNVLNQFQKIIYDYEILSSYIRYHLEQNQAESDFKSGYIIRKLQIFDLINEYTVYDENNNINRDIIKGDLQEFENSLQVNSYTAEGNYYSIIFDFYIDFTHKIRIIYREMTGMLLLALISILIVGFVFIYTIKNMMKQKKLSDMKSDFINNMTHELKTPLSTISIASQSLTDNKIYTDKSKVMGISQLITKQNAHLTHLIDHILDINMWEKDHITLNKNRIEVFPFLKEKIEAFRIEHQN